jgi:hypothetical protein
LGPRFLERSAVGAGAQRGGDPGDLAAPGVALPVALQDDLVPASIAVVFAGGIGEQLLVEGDVALALRGRGGVLTLSQRSARAGAPRNVEQSQSVTASRAGRRGESG